MNAPSRHGVAELVLELEEYLADNDMLIVDGVALRSLLDVHAAAYASIVSPSDETRGKLASAVHSASAVALALASEPDEP